MTTKAKVGDVVLIGHSWCLLVRDDVRGGLRNVVLSSGYIGGMSGEELKDREPIFNLSDVIRILEKQYHETR